MISWSLRNNDNISIGRAISRDPLILFLKVLGQGLDAASACRSRQGGPIISATTAGCISGRPIRDNGIWSNSIVTQNQTPQLGIQCPDISSWSLTSVQSSFLEQVSWIQHFKVWAKGKHSCLLLNFRTLFLWVTISFTIRGPLSIATKNLKEGLFTV